MNVSNILEFLEFAAICYLCIRLVMFAVDIALAWLVLRATNKTPDQLLTEIERDNSLKRVNARLEIIDDVFFLYDKDRNEFLGQGKTAEQVIEHLISRFGNIQVTLIDADSKFKEIFVSQLKTYYENRTSK
jgi:hypothetical protein